MYKYLVAVSRQPDHAKIRAYCDGSVEHFNWLEDLGSNSSAATSRARR